MLTETSSAEGSAPTLEDLRNVKQRLIETEYKIEAKLREEYLETKKDDIYKLFEDGVVGPEDFKIIDSLALRQVAKKLVHELLRRNFDLRNLFAYESATLRDIANDGDAFLNNTRMDGGEGIVLMNWFRNLYESRPSGREGSPPGGLSIPAISAKQAPKYCRITVRHTPFSWWCFGEPVRNELVVMFRSDLTGYDLREMIERSGQFGTGVHYKTYTWVSRMVYGDTIDNDKPIPGILDGAIIKIELRGQEISS